MLSLFHRLSQIRQNDALKIFKGIRNAFLSLYNITLGTTRSNKAILTAHCFLWWILQQGYYLTNRLLLFHYALASLPPFYRYMVKYYFLHMRLLYGVWATLTSTFSSKFDGFARAPSGPWILDFCVEGSSEMLQWLFLHTEGYCLACKA